MFTLAFFLTLPVAAANYDLLRVNTDGTELYFRSNFRLKSSPADPGRAYAWSAAEGLRRTPELTATTLVSAGVEASEDGSIIAELEPRQPPICLSGGSQFPDFTIIRGLPGGVLRLRGIVRLSHNGRFALLSPNSYRACLIQTPSVPLTGDIKLLNLITGEEQLLLADALPIRTAEGNVVANNGTAVFSRQGMFGAPDRDLVIAPWNKPQQTIAFESASGGNIDSAGDFVTYRRDGELRGWHLADGWDTSFGSDVWAVTADLRWFISPVETGLRILDRHNGKVRSLPVDPRLFHPAAFSEDGSTLFYETAAGIIRHEVDSGIAVAVVISSVVQLALPPRIAMGQDYPISRPLHPDIRAEDWRVQLVLEGGAALLLATHRKDDVLWFTVPQDTRPGLITVELTGFESLSPFAPLVGPDAVELVR